MHLTRVTDLEDHARLPSRFHGRLGRTPLGR